MEIGPWFVVPSDRLEKPGIKLATPVYKASDITTAPQRLQIWTNLKNSQTFLNMNDEFIVTVTFCHIYFKIYRQPFYNFAVEWNRKCYG